MLTYTNYGYKNLNPLAAKVFTGWEQMKYKDKK
jgi:hypothetical protein